MEVILLENIENLGSLGDKVSVKAGYARNFLVPQRKAQMATADNLAQFEERRADLEAAAAAAKAENETRKKKIEALGTVVITSKVGSEGKLFGSIGTSDIADAIIAVGGVVEKREVRLPEGTIRTTGEHVIDIHLYTDVDAVITISIVGEE
jgi:large subunit ribosomal protein L9|tara:strand:+ start:5667 stop:6119 length:453 start_codon:yes stop_codon:yes gene_type:complete